MVADVDLKAAGGVDDAIAYFLPSRIWGIKNCAWVGRKAFSASEPAVRGELRRINLHFVARLGPRLGCPLEEVDAVLQFDAQMADRANDDLRAHTFPKRTR